MSGPGVNILYFGRKEPPPPRVPLRAGPLSMDFAGGNLRSIRLGGREVIRRIYAAVRDRNWGTVPGRLSGLEIEAGGDSFRVRFVSHHVENEIDFLWRGEIAGEASGRVDFRFEGTARTTFERNRIGFCVLHPMRECAGIACRIEKADGSSSSDRFPLDVAADQPVGAFFDLAAMAHEVEPGVWAEVRFRGDLFELEDQRNWTDASFKTFCTPLRLPFPVEVRAGTRIEQSVTLTLKEETPSSLAYVQCVAPAADLQTPVSVQVAAGRGKPLPHIGLGAASHGKPLSPRERERLRALNLSHLRVDIHPKDRGSRGVLQQAAEEASAVGGLLEVALHLSEEALDELPALAREVEKLPVRVLRWLIFPAAGKVTTGPLVEAARRSLIRFGAPIGGGSDADFYELNQGRPPAEPLDFVSFSMNPQVHADDDDSLVETLEAQAAPIESARRYFRGMPIVVSPITLRPRFNAVATGPVAGPPASLRASLPAGWPAGRLPSEVDPRQMSLFGAGWTLGSVKYVAEAGAASATYFETSGWRGVLETDAGSPLPEKFLSIPGGVFPLYHVLADIGEFAGGALLPSRSGDPHRTEAVALRRGARRRLLVATFSIEPQKVRMEGTGERVTIRILDERSAERALREPEEYRREPGLRREAPGGVLEIELPPYAVARIDWEGEP